LARGPYSIPVPGFVGRLRLPTLIHRFRALLLDRHHVDLWLDHVLVATTTPGESMDDPFLSLSRLARFFIGTVAGSRPASG
jgi:hypothetical protein